MLALLMCAMSPDYRSGCHEMSHPQYESLLTGGVLFRPFLYDSHVFLLVSTLQVKVCNIRYQYLPYLLPTAVLILYYLYYYTEAFLSNISSAREHTLWWAVSVYTCQMCFFARHAIG